MSLKTGFGNSKQLGIASALLLLLVLSWSSFAGAFSTTVETGGSQIHVFIEDTDFEMSDDQILQWIQRAGDIVTTYFGRFPGEKAYLAIMGQPGKGVGGGVALGGVDAVINVRIGLDTDVADLRDDWVMVHELIHLAFPKMHRRHHWAEEGLSVYVESVARAQTEDIRAETMWSSFMDGMPKGLPRSGDRGLDHTPTWGRTYWGGALFYLLADIEIIRLTNGQKTLRDGLRAIVHQGFSIVDEEELLTMFRLADRATGVPVLEDTYNAMANDPADHNLELLWRNLGVSRTDGIVSFDDSAPWAEIRKIITRQTEKSAQQVQ